MFVPFDSLPESARVWVYQADRELQPEQVDIIESNATEFLKQWAAHGAPLISSFTIRHRRFFIIGVDESSNPVTGCSTDDQVRFVQLLQTRLGVNFFDRTQVAMLVEDEVHMVSLKEVKQKNSGMNRDTLTFNNLVNTKGQLNSEWMKPAGDSWLARFI